MKHATSVLLIFSVVGLFGCASLPVPQAPTLPDNPIISNLRFSYSVDVPDVPPAPTLRDIVIERKSHVGFRYITKGQREKVSGDLVCSIIPLNINPLKTTGLDGRPLVINPVGFTMYLVVKNQSSHIVKLEKSILQFEDFSGNEFRIGAGGGWAESTSEFLDSISKLYEDKVESLLSEYGTRNKQLITELIRKGNAAKEDNNQKLKKYTDFITAEYKSRFDIYEKEVQQYNKNNHLFTDKKGTRVYRSEPFEIEAGHLSPGSLIEKKRYDCSQANYQIDQIHKDFESEISKKAEATRNELRNAVESNSKKWRRILNGVETEATKVVKSDGVFDPIVIPPGKHRTILIPGISGMSRWPNTLKLMLYDVPAETDAAGNVTRRLNLSFDLQREEVDVFFVTN